MGRLFYRLTLAKIRHRTLTTKQSLRYGELFEIFFFPIYIQTSYLWPLIQGITGRRNDPTDVGPRICSENRDTRVGTRIRIYARWLVILCFPEKILRLALSEFETLDEHISDAHLNQVVATTRLREDLVDLLPANHCTSSMICSKENIRQTLPGDSGGPLLVQHGDNFEWRVIGIHQSGKMDGTKCYYTILFFCVYFMVFTFSTSCTAWLWLDQVRGTRSKVHWSCHREPSAYFVKKFCLAILYLQGS